MKSDPKKREVKMLDVTPAMAAEWLEKNTLNRDVRPGLVESMARTMGENEWRLTPEPVAFCDPFVDPDTKEERGETLIEGQHRLLAIVKSGKTVPLTVWWHCDPREFEVVGTARTRRQGDILKITRRGLKHPTAVASVVNSFLRYGLSLNVVVESWMVRRTLRECEADIIRVVEYKLKLKQLAHGPMVSALTLAQLIDPVATVNLVNSIINGATGAKSGSPVRVLREYLFHHVIDSPRDVIDVYHYKVANGVAAHLRGDTSVKLKLDTEGLQWLREKARPALTPILTDIYGRAPSGFYLPKLSPKLTELATK